MNKLTPIWHDFCAYPFRLYFLSAAVVGILMSLVWLLFATDIWFINDDFISFHAFTYLQILGGAAYAGFLFTAIVAWTNYPGKLARHAQITWSIWLLAFIAGFVNVAVATWIMCIFWLYLLSFFSYLVFIARDDRQLGILILLAMMLVLTIYSSLQLDSFSWQQILHLNIIGITLINFRVGKVMGSEALKSAHLDNHCQFIPNPFYKNLVVYLIYLLIITNLYFQDSIVEGWLSLAVAGAVLGRLREWHYWVLFKQHYIRWFYLVSISLGLAYAWRGVSLINEDAFQAILAFHVLAILGVILMIFIIMNVAGLRHSGLALCFPYSSRLAMLLIVIATISRSIVYYFYLGNFFFYIVLPALCLLVAFVLYLVTFYQIFIHNQAHAGE